MVIRLCFSSFSPLPNVVYVTKLCGEIITSRKGVLVSMMTDADSLGLAYFTYDEVTVPNHH